MGWLGTLFVGAVIALAGRMAHPSGAYLRWGRTLLLGAGVALAAKFGGQAAGIFREGELATWLAVLIAPTVVVMMYGVFAGRKK